MKRAVLLLTVMAALLASCASDPTRGYTMGSGHRKDVRSVAVPVWDNRTFAVGLEADLTEALIKEIQRSTPWVVVDSGATTRLEGVITAADLRKLATDSTSGLVQELAVDIAVDFTWTSNRTRKPLIERRDFRSQGVFAPTLGIGEPIEVGQLSAVEALARDIVHELRSAW